MTTLDPVTLPAAIRAAFADYFSGAVTLPEGPLPARGQISMARWHVTYVFWEVDGRQCLDFYATNRFSSDQHARILESGTVELLEAPRDGFSHDPKVPGDRERAEREYFDHNRRVQALLRSKGFLGS